MTQKISFSLGYRDMWQSFGKYQPKAGELEDIAPVIADMQVFDRVETNGGSFEQVQLLAGENPNEAVRKWTRALNETGLQSCMLDRGLYGLRFQPCSTDLRRLMYRVKKAQGVRVARTFCALNDERNLQTSVRLANEAGLISQACILLVHSPVHTEDYYRQLANHVCEIGADEISLKDSAGTTSPVRVGKLVRHIRDNHPDIKINFDARSGPGLSPAAILEAVRAGCDSVVVGMEPLSWGSGHADVLSVLGMLEGIEGIELPKLNKKAYFKAAEMNRSFLDEGPGFFVHPQNYCQSPLSLFSGLSAGMRANMSAWLEDSMKRIRKADGSVSPDEMLFRVHEELETVWRETGYPPLVNPVSRHIAMTAIYSVEDQMRDREAFSRIDGGAWDVLSGRTGKLPASPSDRIRRLAEEKGIEFFDGDPQDLYPDSLEEFKAEMKENQWDYGPELEELFELAMHPEPYRLYRSGKARDKFEKDLAKKREEAAAAERTPCVVPGTYVVRVEGESYEVEIEPSGQDGIFIESVEGALVSIGAKKGDMVQEGETLFVVESMKMESEIVSPCAGRVVDIQAAVGDELKKGEIVMVLEAL